VPSKARRVEHYLAIAEFYGRQLVEDMRTLSLPDFVLVEAARRTARFALMATRLDGARGGGRAVRSGAVVGAATDGPAPT
jgi:hypothetical protein